VARGRCWHSEDAPEVNRVFGIGGAVSGDVVGHARPVSMGCDLGEAPGIYRNIIPDLFYRAMSRLADNEAGVGYIEKRGRDVETGLLGYELQTDLRSNKIKENSKPSSMGGLHHLGE